MEPRWLDAAEQRAWRAYFQMAMLLEDTLDQQLQESANLPHLYYAIMVVLSEAPDRRMRMTDLAASLKITRSRLNYAVTRLDRDDWVRREQSGADRRGQFAVLTAEGMAALERAVPGHVATVRAMVFDRLSPEQVRHFGDVCEIILSTLTSDDRTQVVRTDLPWRR